MNQAIHTKKDGRWFPSLGILALLLFQSLESYAGETATNATPAAATVTLDGRSPGRVFEGIGGLSAGACTRLLLDYPEPQRGELLDFLFKPNFGAALHHLKVEIGGDVNSTWGSEPSHARTRAEFEHPTKECFDRGYEWWLMREAKKRNPNIYLDILQWGAPDWIGDKDFPDPSGSDPNTLAWDKRMLRNRKKFFTQDNADFIVSFIEGARKYHGLEINYCGTWNETPIGGNWIGEETNAPPDIPWIKLLRKTLDRHGLTNVGIIARDLDGGRNQPRTWRIADQMKKDPELARAIYAAGAHYPARWSTDVAKQCGKPLWASEDNGGWQGCAPYTENPPVMGWPAACGMARMFNLNYIDAAMTKTIVCALIAAYYENLFFANCGALQATTPWSGHYEIWSPLWAMAHTGQFAQPGWKYLDGGCSHLKGGGSYVTLRNPDAAGDYSMIIETGDAKATQNITVRLTGGLSAKAVHVWRSSEQSQFERRSVLQPIGDSFTIELEPGCIYSLTTTTGQQKGKTSPPPPAPFPTPYVDDFESYSAGKMAKYFADQSGTFEVAARPDGGKCLRQTLARRGLDWEHAVTPDPYTMIGSVKWRNYEVSCDALIEGTGYAAIFGRIKRSTISAAAPLPPYGYWLKVNADGKWELKAFTSTLASGTVAFAAHQGHKLALKFSGARITASIDGVEVKSIEDYTFFAGGMAGLGTGWNTARFDNFAVREVAGPAISTVNLAAGKPTTASSDYSDAFTAGLATDGNPQTRWNSRVGDKDGAWLEVDFGQPMRFNRVTVREFDQRIKNYTIQYLDGTQWREAHSSAGESSVVFPAVQASKLRLLVVSAKLEPSVFELEVFDDGI